MQPNTRSSVMLEALEGLGSKKHRSRRDPVHGKGALEHRLDHEVRVGALAELREPLVERASDRRHGVLGEPAPLPRQLASAAQMV